MWKGHSFTTWTPTVGTELLTLVSVSILIRFQVYLFWMQSYSSSFCLPGDDAGSLSYTSKAPNINLTPCTCDFTACCSLEICLSQFLILWLKATTENPQTPVQHLLSMFCSWSDTRNAFSLLTYMTHAHERACMDAHGKQVGGEYSKSMSSLQHDLRLNVNCL